MMQRWLLLMKVLHLETWQQRHQLQVVMLQETWQQRHQLQVVITVRGQWWDCGCRG